MRLYDSDSRGLNLRENLEITASLELGPEVISWATFKGWNAEEVDVQVSIDIYLY